VNNIDRGLRGKERDAAYETAVNEAQTHFNKCSHCGQHVCAHCWNESVGLCEGCAPDAAEAAARAAATIALEQKVADVRSKGSTTHALITCAVCGQEAGGGKFCQNCGSAAVSTRACAKCQHPLSPTAKFCGECGASAV
jgi:hypothetical protein